MKYLLMLTIKTNMKICVGKWISIFSLHFSFLIFIKTILILTFLFCASWHELVNDDTYNVSKRIE